MVKTVIFSVGVEHPLYKKPVLAEIESTTAGYNKKCIYGHTVKPVHWNENPKGILVFKGDKFVGYKTRPACDKIHEGFIEKVV